MTSGQLSQAGAPHTPCKRHYPRRRPWPALGRTLVALVTFVSAVLLPAAAVVNAASGTLYMDQATDPHGGIWLKGTIDGTRTGTMDSSTTPPPPGTLTSQAAANTAPAGWSFGHLWETDVPSGFCRVDVIADPNIQGATMQLFARSTAYVGAPTNGCTHTGQKSSQPILDPRRNTDGTFYVYSCDWAVFSQGCYRMTYDPGAQVMIKSELLAAGRFPTAGGKGIKPFATALGADGSLYVTSDLLPYVYRITIPNDPNTGNQQVAIIATAASGTRVRAETFACWAPLRGGTTALPTCAQSASAGNPAPDLVLTEKAGVTVVMNATSCLGVAVDVNGSGGPLGTPACLAVQTPMRVLTPMGAQTQGAWNQVVGTNGLPTWGPAFDPNTIYITDSPGATSQILRYTISTNTQDSYSNYGVLPNGTVAQYAFGFSVTQSPDGRMFLGDDPTAGSVAFSGHIFTVAARSPADVLGQPGLPATPPPPPSQSVGAIYGSGVTLPNDGVWLPGPAGTPGHLWISDGLSGFCRMDTNTTPGATAPYALNSATCSFASAKPGQPAFDPSANVVYLPDDAGGAKGRGLIALTFDQTGTICLNSDGSLVGPESVCNPVAIDPGATLDGQRIHAAGIDFTAPDHPVYVGFLNRNTTAPTEIARVNNPLCATGLVIGTGAAPACAATGAPVSPSVDFIANATRHKPIFNIVFIGADLYNGNNGGLDWLPSAKTCQAGQCTSIQLLNVRGPRGMATDGTHIYMAGPSIPAGCPPTCPAPGTLVTPVDVYNTLTGSVAPFASQAVLADGITLAQFNVVDSLTVDPAGNVYVGDDPNVLGTPAGQGHVYKVSVTPQEPMPALVSRPNNPTNNNNTPAALINPQPAPVLAFQSADKQATFKCSLARSGAPDAWANCGGVGNGSVAYGTDAAGNLAINAPNAIPDGTYVFRVQGFGIGGLASIPNAYTFTVDTVPPVVSITNQPLSPTNKNTPSYAFNANKTNTTFTCSLTPAGGADSFSLCSSPTSYTAQRDGSYTFKVTGTDPAGNSTTASVALVIDTIAPSVTASPAGGAFTTAQSVVLTATDAPAAGTPIVYYTVDGSTPTTTSPGGPSPVTVNIASSLSLKYFAVDLAGNASPVASQVYQIGTVSITQNPPMLTNRNQVTFGFADTVAGATFSCSLMLQSSAFDAFSPCVSPMTYPAQPDGAYRFVVRDTAGSQASFLFTIDTAPVVLTMTQNPPNPDPGSSATFGWTSNKAGTAFQCSFGFQTAVSPAFSACASPISYTGLTMGQYVFKVAGTDLAGNTSPSLTYLFNVAPATPPSATAPQQTLTGLMTAQAGTSATTTTVGPITAATGGVPVTISWTGTACASGAVNCNIDHYLLQQSINGGGFSSIVLPSPTATSVTLYLKPSPTNQPSAATSYRFQVQAVDVAGNLSPFATGATFSVPDTDDSFQSTFNGSWSGVNIASAFGGSVKESSTNGAFAQPSSAAPATSLAWVSTLGPDRGRAQVKVDGQLMATVDLYSPTQTAAQVVWAINGLAAGTNHNIQIVATGSHNTLATASKVDYDAIVGLR
jgi:hypothetical protein